MNNFESINEPGQHLEINNTLQVELAERKDFGKELTDYDLADWVGNYSGKFRELIVTKFSENPNLWTDLENPELREKILQELENELYQEDSFEKMAA